MKAMLQFNLPEERDDFETTVHATDWRLTVADFMSELRRRVKYEASGKELQDFYEWANNLLSEDGLDPW